MGKQETISVALEAERLADLDRVASQLGCSRDDLIGAAIGRIVDEQDSRPAHARLGFNTEAELKAYLKPALDDIAAGRIHNAEEVDAIFDAMIDRQRARGR